MENFEEELNKDYNYFSSCIRRFSKNLKETNDRQLVQEWLDELSKQTKTIQESQMRNDFLFYLLKCCETGILKDPFTHLPPKGEFKKFQHLLSKEIDETSPGCSYKKDPGETSIRLPKIFDKSPDKGAFLISQPIPRHGTVCYLAVVNRAGK